MRSIFPLALAIVLLAPGDARATPQQDLERVLSFESGDLSGWLGGPRETLSQDSVVVHTGRYSGRIDRETGTSGPTFSSFTLSVPRSFSGETLALRGWLRTESVSGFAGLWLRQDGRDGSVQFDNMASRNLSGTTGWTEYTISVPLDERTRTVFLGALLVGEGTVWVDDLELIVDGGPAAEAPPLDAPSSPVELDTEFDDGSHVEARDVSTANVEHLGLLGRVWGFVKYHHSRLRKGEVNWDYELFRVLPAVLGAPDRESATAAISDWLASLEDPDACEPCAEPAVEPHLTPDLDWIRDRRLLGDVLSERLQVIYEHRPASSEHYYVAHAPGVGNPVFSNEASYSDQPLPDAGYRLLALYRFWNIIEYWYPNRDLIGSEWEEVLAAFVPRMMDARTSDEYRLAMMQLTARIDDTHANIWAHLDLQPPRGPAKVPIVIRFIEGKAVVTDFSHPVLGPATGLSVGDVVEEIDGRSIDSLLASWRAYYSASNEPTRLRDIARNLTRGEPGSVRISGTGAAGDFRLTTQRVPTVELDETVGRTHDLAGESFQLLSDQVAYLKLSSVVAADVENYLSRAADSDVLVVDIRNYPSEFVVFALGGHLVTEVTEFARFTRGDPANPGAFLWTTPVSLQPLEPHFSGVVVILLDEVSQSQAEYTAMALRASPNAIVVGSTTAGADGNISPIPLPGGISSMISGIGVFYPDQQPTQQIGIIPDLEVRPTIAGVRAGRDEVLEAAVSYVLGREFRLPNR